jgi:hypothetical protein
MLYDHTLWSSDGLDPDSLVPFSVNDGEMSGQAFRWLNGAGTSRVKFFSATAKTFRECRFTVDTSIAAVATPTFEHSDDGSAWTAITATLVNTVTSGNYRTYVYQWASVGAKNYWAAKRSSGSDSTAVTEVWFREFESTFVDISELRVYDIASGSRSLFARVVPTDQPTTTARLSVTPVMTWVEAVTSDTGTVNVLVTVVGTDGRESEGVSVTTFDSATVSARYVTSVGGNAGAVSSGVVAAMASASIGVGRDSMAGFGGRALVAPNARLTVDLSAVATSITVENAAFANGDRVVLQKIVGTTPQTEHLAITSAASGTGPYTYSVTRNLDGSGANAWSVNDVVVGLGQTGSAFIDLYSATGLKSGSEVGPTVVGNVRNSGTWNDWSPRWAVGNLNGLYGYSSNEYGAAFGNPSGAWLKIDPTSGVRLGDNATTLAEIASGAFYLGPLNYDGTTLSVDDESQFVADGITFAPSGGGSSYGSIGKDGFSNGVAIKQGGASLAVFGATRNLYVTGDFECGDAYVTALHDINEDQVVGVRGAAVADATGAGDVVAQLNALLARLRAHGLIAT